MSCGQAGFPEDLSQCYSILYSIVAPPTGKDTKTTARNGVLYLFILLSVCLRLCLMCLSSLLIRQCLFQMSNYFSQCYGHSLNECVSVWVWYV